MMSLRLIFNVISESLPADIDETSLKMYTLRLATHFATIPGIVNQINASKGLNLHYKGNIGTIKGVFFGGIAGRDREGEGNYEGKPNHSQIFPNLESGDVDPINNDADNIVDLFRTILYPDHPLNEEEIINSINNSAFSYDIKVAIVNAINWNVPLLKIAEQNWDFNRGILALNPTQIVNKEPIIIEDPIIEELSSDDDEVHVDPDAPVDPVVVDPADAPPPVVDPADPIPPAPGDAPPARPVDVDPVDPNPPVQPPVDPKKARITAMTVSPIVVGGVLLIGATTLWILENHAKTIFNSDIKLGIANAISGFIPADQTALKEAVESPWIQLAVIVGISLACAGIALLIAHLATREVQPVEPGAGA